MKKTQLLLLFCLLILRGVTTGQNIYESIGKTTEILTLSNGQYQEFFPNDTIVRIGSVLFNTQTQEVVDFVTVSDSVNPFEADVVSRFLSVDPIARQYPELTPYQFASNRPIDGIDLDGLEYTFAVNTETGVTKIKLFTYVFNESHSTKTTAQIMESIAKQYLSTVTGSDNTQVQPINHQASTEFVSNQIEVDGKKYEFSVEYQVLDKPFYEDRFKVGANPGELLKSNYYTVLTDVSINDSGKGGTTVSVSKDKLTYAMFTVIGANDYGSGVYGESESTTRTGTHEWLHPVTEHPWAWTSTIRSIWNQAVEDIADKKTDTNSVKTIQTNIMTTQENNNLGKVDPVLQKDTNGTNMTTEQRRELIKSVTKQ